MSERALLAQWRDALRDSELDGTAKLCGYVISTYWNGNGRSAFPAKTTIATAASMRSVRAVDRAILRLERAGFLDVSRSKGRSSNGYIATLPTPHDETGLPRTDIQGSDNSNPVPGDAQPRTALHSTPSPETGESGKAKAIPNAYPRARARGEKQRADSRDYSEYNRA